MSFDEWYPEPKNWDYPIASMIALVIVSFGVRSFYDLAIGGVAQFVYWFAGQKGPDGMWSALAGLQISRGQWRTGAFPTLLDAYETYTDYKKMTDITFASVYRTVAWFFGFFSGYILKWLKLKF